MKSTTLDTTSNLQFSRQVRAQVGQPEGWLAGNALAARADRFKALPFMLLMIITGLPFNYTLEPARPITVADATELTMQAQSSDNFGNSIFIALFLASLYLVSALMLAKRPQKVAAILRQQWPLFLILVYVALSAFWSYYPEKVITNTIHNIGAACIAMAAALRYRHDPWLFPKHLGYVLGVNMFFQVAAVVLIPSYAIDWQGRWHGLAPHPNTFGAMALTTLWANAAILICRKHDKFHLHLLFAALAVIGMIGADSVTSMLTSMAMVMFIYLISKLQKLGAGVKFYFTVLAMVFLFALMLALIGGALDMSSLLNMFGRDAELTGRTSVWRDALAAIAERPLQGWSFDDHAYLIQNKGMPYPTYHNGYLDVAVCGGLFSMLLLVLLFGNWAIGFTKSSRVAREIAPLSAAFVITFLIHNLTEASLIGPRGQLWQIFLALVFLGACKRWQPQPTWSAVLPASSVGVSAVAAHSTSIAATTSAQGLGGMGSNA